jgi:hypothetical protein
MIGWLHSLLRLDAAFRHDVMGDSDPPLHAEAEASCRDGHNAATVAYSH